MKRLILLFVLVLSACATDPQSPPRPPDYLSWVGLPEAEVMKKCASFYQTAYWINRSSYVAKCRTTFMGADYGVWVENGRVRSVDR